MIFKRKIEINKNFNQLEIIIPNKFHKEELFFFGFFSIIIFVFSYNFLGVVNHFADVIIEIPNDWLKIIFVVFILFMGFKFVMILISLFVGMLDMFFGNTVLKLDSSNLEIKNQLFGKGELKKYDLGNVKNLFFNYALDFEQREEFELKEIEKEKRGSLVFLYEEKFNLIASRINKEEAKEILNALIQSEYIDSEVIKPYDILND